MTDVVLVSGGAAVTPFTTPELSARSGLAAGNSLTGLRNPCVQIDRFEPGLLKEVVGTDADGATVRKAGVMAVVVTGGIVRPGDAIDVRLPAEPFEALAPV